MRRDRLLRLVKEILFREWDPIRINSNPECRDEYDSYAPTLCRMLTDGVDQFRLAAHLSQLQRVSMGLSKIDEELNNRVARRLLSLFEKPS